MEVENIHQIAESLLEETGAVERQECHDYCVSNDDSDALNEAYKLANSRVTSEKIKLPAGFSRKDFTDLIKEIYDQTPDACPKCQYNRDSN